MHATEVPATTRRRIVRQVSRNGRASLREDRGIRWLAALTLILAIASGILIMASRGSPGPFVWVAAVLLGVLWIITIGMIVRAVIVPGRCVMIVHPADRLVELAEGPRMLRFEQCTGVRLTTWQEVAGDPRDETREFFAEGVLVVHRDGGAHEHVLFRRRAIVAAWASERKALNTIAGTVGCPFELITAPAVRSA